MLRTPTHPIIRVRDFFLTPPGFFPIFVLKLVANKGVLREKKTKKGKNLGGGCHFGLIWENISYVSGIFPDPPPCMASQNWHTSSHDLYLQIDVGDF